MHSNSQTAKYDKRTLQFKAKVRLIIQTFLTLTSIFFYLQNSNQTSLYFKQSNGGEGEAAVEGAIEAKPSVVLKTS